jgi:hypothetical protein
MKTLKAQNRFDEPVTSAVLERAIESGRNRRASGLHATIVQYLSSSKSLMIGFADQSAVTLPVKNYPELANLSVIELKHLSVGFGGSALCLEERDLHVSITGLVSASESLMEMAATVIAARNGSRSSAVKSRTSRVNGQKGGRPRKLAAAG